MNKRIKEISEQALDRVVPYTWTRLDYDEIQKLQECFAQLIVQDCLRICQEGTTTQTTSAGAADLIKQHFGVKE